MAEAGELILVRHGETEWSRDRRHTGRTDVPLTPTGEQEARALAPRLREISPRQVRVSPARRAQRTAQLAGLTGVQTDPDLWEWDYGGYEGLTTPEVQQTRPGWSVWAEGVVPGDADHPGETVAQVGSRADAVLSRVRPALPGGDVVLVAHAHVLRVLTARWLGLEPAAGRLFRLETGTISRLGTEHGNPVILAWNLPS